MVVLITGCRSGFGLRAAVTAARSGHTVYAGLRDLSTAGRLQEAASGLSVHPVQLDVTVPEQREAVVSQILAKHGQIDALVNNAGVVLGGQVELVTEAELRRVFEVNVFAVWSLIRLVVPGMRTRGDGVIINISSTSGRIALPGLGAYSSSKFAVEGLSETLRHELAPFGVRVAVIEPGPYKTDMFSRNKQRAAASKAPDHPYVAFDAHADAIFERSVAHRAGDPQDVADQIVSLLGKPSFPLRHPMSLSTKLRLALVRFGPFWLWETLLRRLLTPR